MNWVESHLACSPDNIWLAVCDRVQADVDVWHELSVAPGHVSITRDHERMRIWKSLGSDVTIWASLELKDQHIKAQTGKSLDGFGNTDVKDFNFIPTVSQTGECRLKSKNEELEIWQVSRILLEPILFDVRSVYRTGGA
jgi:hypothetical protein